MRDFIIVGQGIAGTMLALELEARGMDILVVDDGNRTSSTRAASGAITPLTGQRLALTWRVDELLPKARAAYRQLEARWGISLLEELPTYRVFQSQEEVEAWAKRSSDPIYQPYLGTAFTEADVADWVHAPLGGARINGSAWLHTEHLLDRARLEWNASGQLINARIEASLIQPTPCGVKTPFGLCKTLVWCEGFRATRNPFFEKLPFRNARGDILSIRCDLPHDRIWNAGVFVQPHAGGLFKAGASYDWNLLEPVPVPAGREEIESKLRTLLRGPFEVVVHDAGVRPVAVQRVPVMGSHPDHPGIAILNGLGSKGSLQAPAMAEILADHLIKNTPLPKETDLANRLRP